MSIKKHFKDSKEAAAVKAIDYYKKLAKVINEVGSGKVYIFADFKFSDKEIPLLHVGSFEGGWKTEKGELVKRKDIIKGMFLCENGADGNPAIKIKLKSKIGSKHSKFVNAIESANMNIEFVDKLDGVAEDLDEDEAVVADASKASAPKLSPEKQKMAAESVTGMNNLNALIADFSKMKKAEEVDDDTKIKGAQKMEAIEKLIASLEAKIAALKA